MFATTRIARADFDDATLRPLYVLSNALMAEPYEHFAHHARTNDELPTARIARLAIASLFVSIDRASGSVEVGIRMAAAQLAAYPHVLRDRARARVYRAQPRLSRQRLLPGVRVRGRRPESRGACC